MQIIVNTRLLLHNKMEGMGWFAHQTLKRITQNNPDVHFVFLFDRPYHESFVYSDNVTPLILSPQARHPFLYYLYFQHSVRNVVSKMKPDLYFSPDGFMPLGLKVKALPVIHDINFHHHPKDVRWLTSKYYNYYFPRFAKEATRIVTVSEYSKTDISEVYGISREKIDVVYNGVNEFIRPLSDEEKYATKSRFTKGHEYFVYVGSIHPRKNVTRLLQAYSEFKKENNNKIKLVFAGPQYWGMSEVYKSLKELKIEEEVVFTNRLSNEDLNLVLGSALALTYIPYYEGFGIPIVEAMRAEVPIITSNVTSLPEVAGEAGLFVNPMSVEEIKNAMKKIWTDEELRKNLIEKGNVQVEKFSWDESAAKLWESISGAINQ
ncbi:MAG: glycosyltransferase family 4 protein [Bacteroidia bacterium]